MSKTVNSYTTEGKTLHVIGHIWQGRRCTYEYPLKDTDNPTTLAEAKRIAGDFESLESAKVVTIHQEVIETVTTRRLQ